MRDFGENPKSSANKIMRADWSKMHFILYWYIGGLAQNAFFSIGIVEELYQVGSKENLCAIGSRSVRANGRKISIDIVGKLAKNRFFCSRK